MINVTSERVFRLGDCQESPLIDALTEIFQGRVSYSTLRRYIHEGIEVNGEIITLDSCLLGGGVQGTSIEACQRFLQQLNATAKERRDGTSQKQE